MRVMKGILAIILSIVMLASLCGVMGYIAVKLSITPDSIRTAINKTSAVDHFAEEIKENVPSYLGTSYQSAMEKVLHSDSMNDYYVEYLDTAIQAAIDGEDIPAVDSEALQNAFIKGFDEIQDSLGLNTWETYLFDQVKDTLVTKAAESVSSYLGQYTVEITDQNTLLLIKALSLVSKPMFLIISAILLLLSFFSLAALLFPGGTWLIVTGLLTLICGGAYYITSGILGSTPQTGETENVISDVLMSMFSTGTGSIATAGLFLGGVLFAIGFIYKLFRLVIPAR